MAQKRKGRDLLTPAAIVDRALALADAEGVNAVTIRRLARELGVTPMALYWHFKDKDELLDALADRLVAEIDPAIDENAPWQRQLAALLGAHLAVLRSHPSAPALLWTRNNTSEPALQLTEVALDVLRRAGFSPDEATHIARQAVRTTTALVATQPLFSAGTDHQANTLRFLKSLPAGRYPRIIEAAAPLSGCDDPEAHYDFGLKMVLTSIEAMAERRRAVSDASTPDALFIRRWLRVRHEDMSCDHPAGLLSVAPPV